MLADVDGPLVNGYMALSTEAHDDDGLPHTLEHLGRNSIHFKNITKILTKNIRNFLSESYTKKIK